MQSIQIFQTEPCHRAYVYQICEAIEEAAIQRGTGIAKRNPLDLLAKIECGNAVIALDGDKLAGFCYIQLWSEGTMASHSGLIVLPDYRKMGLAARLKSKAMEIVREHYPEAKIFGITTNLQVMKINTELGYRPTTFSEITQDEKFWQQCSSCPNYDILQRTNKKMCLCTAMIALSMNDINKKVA
jgi:GNAT superfamily N-acetyltransferase